MKYCLLSSSERAAPEFHCACFPEYKYCDCIFPNLFSKFSPSPLCLPTSFWPWLDCWLSVIFLHFTFSDIILCVLWALLTIGGTVFQYYYLKKRGLLVIPMSDYAQQKCREEMEREAEEDNSSGRCSCGSWYLSCPSCLCCLRQASAEPSETDALLGGQRTSRWRSALSFIRSFLARRHDRQVGRPLLEPTAVTPPEPDSPPVLQ